MSEKPNTTFAHNAMQLIAAGNAAEALQLCAEGIAWYPDYASGYLVLAKAYRALGKIEDAEIVCNEIWQTFSIRVPKEHTPLVELPVEPESIHVDATAPALVVSEEHAVAGEVVEAVVDIATPVEQEAVALTLVQHLSIPATEYVHSTAEVHSQHVTPLKLIELGTLPNDTRIIKSSSVRLIPGLEFATLTMQGNTQHSRHSVVYDPLPEPPPFRDFKVKLRTMSATPTTPVVVAPPPATGSTTEVPNTAPERRLVTLEDLAKRLENARIPRSEATYKQQQAQPNLPVATPNTRVVSETIANILFQQGHYQQALDAYAALIEAKPERGAELTKKILECKRLLGAS